MPSSEPLGEFISAKWKAATNKKKLKPNQRLVFGQREPEKPGVVFTSISISRSPDRRGVACSSARSSCPQQAGRTPQGSAGWMALDKPMETNGNGKRKAVNSDQHQPYEDKIKCSEFTAHPRHTQNTSHNEGGVSRKSSHSAPFKFLWSSKLREYPC